jgi:hypothetical protein
MSPEQSAGQLLMSEPIVQTAVVLGGFLLLWYEVRDIRKRIKAACPLTDLHSVITLCNGLIAVRAKTLVAGVIAIQFGFCLLLASAKLVPPEIALSFLAILIFLTLIPAIVYFMFWGAPVPLLRWLLADLRLSQTNSD